MGALRLIHRKKSHSIALKVYNNGCHLTELIDDIAPGMIRRVLTSNEASIAPTEWMILERVIICFKSNHSISRPVHLITVVDKDCIRLVAICDYNGLKGVGLCVKEQK